MKKIRGQKALITGAGSGIGRELSLQLAAEGADLYLVDVDEERLDTVVNDVRELGIEAVGRYCDLSDAKQITATVEHLFKDWGTVDILINNAGVGYYGTTLKMSAEQWDHLLSINLLAPIQLTRELLPTLLKSRDPHILNIASICGIVTGGRSAAYHVSKFGLVGLSEALRSEYSRQGIGVTVVCPGTVETEFFDAAANGDAKKPMPTPPSWISATPQRVAQKAIRAMTKDKAIVLVTPLAYFLYYTKRFAPWFLDGIQRLGRRRGTKKRLANLAASAQSPSERVHSQTDLRSDRAA